MIVGNAKELLLPDFFKDYINSKYSDVSNLVIRLEKEVLIDDLILPDFGSLQNIVLHPVRDENNIFSFYKFRGNVILDVEEINYFTNIGHITYTTLYDVYDADMYIYIINFSAYIFSVGYDFFYYKDNIFITEDVSNSYLIISNKGVVNL